ncbi:MAG: SDR family oxidoreductase [Chloroflexota bacterium]|nr:SDR family oxidoreductase [Dehalococcoidia bacterium]MDW8255315.1 SDR family oxidoreductase [Chloroflexota bacterium]
MSEELGLVAVAGATGRTGKLCVEKLAAMGTPVRAIVRSREKAASLPSGVEVAVADICDRQAVRQALEGVTALIIATSAQPRMREGGRGPMDMYYPEDGTPEKVDYHGQVNLIDAAKEAGVKKVVLISSLGITKPDNMLNMIGNGRILEWKLKSEDYLRASGLDYTIVRPGHLEVPPHPPRTLVVGTGDTLQGAVSREQLADVCIAALRSPAARNKTFELISVEGPPTTDYDALFAQV